MYFGNREVRPEHIMRLAVIAGAVGEDDDEPDAIFLRFEKASYSKDEMLELAVLVAELQPDECSVENGELRLWWD